MQGTTAVVDGLRAEGFRVNVGYVQWALRDRHIPKPAKGPGGGLLWTAADVQRLRSFLRRQGRAPKKSKRFRENWAWLGAMVVGIAKVLSMVIEVIKWLRGG